MCFFLSHSFVALAVCFGSLSCYPSSTHFQHVLSWAGGPCGRCGIPVLHSVVLPIVFLVTMFPAALRSLTRSFCVNLGWFLTVLMIIEAPQGEILHGAPDRGRLWVILCSFLLSPAQAAWWWSHSPFQPFVGLQSCPWHPWTALWSWPWCKVWNLIDWLLLWTGVFYLFKRVLLISAHYLHKRHIGAINLTDW